MLSESTNQFLDLKKFTLNYFKMNIESMNERIKRQTFGEERYRGREEV